MSVQEITSQEEEMEVQLVAIEPSPYDRLLIARDVYGKDLGATLSSIGYNVINNFSPHGSEVRVAMFAPKWLPRNTPVDRDFAYSDVNSDKIIIGFAFTGTDHNVFASIKEGFYAGFSRIFDNNVMIRKGDIAVSEVQHQLGRLLTSLPRLFTCGKRVEVHLIGHSMGGFMAETVAIRCFDYFKQHGMDFRCTTFESPGVPPSYVQTARQLEEQCGVMWRDVMHTYLGCPNAFNVLFTHIGSITHVDIPIRQTPLYAVNCIVKDATRTVVLAVALQQVALLATGGAIMTAGTGTAAGAGIGAGCTAMGCTGLAVMTGLASILGMEVCELLDQHKIEHMMNCFDRQGTGELLPAYRIDMESWPEPSVLDTVMSTAKWALPSYIDNTNNGLVTIFSGRHQTMKRGLKKLKGYKPRAAPPAGTYLGGAVAAVRNVASVVKAPFNLGGMVRRRPTDHQQMRDQQKPPAA